MHVPNPKKRSTTVIFSNVNMVKDNDFSDSDIFKYASVKYYSFSGSAINMYAYTLVRLYESLFSTSWYIP